MAKPRPRNDLFLGEQTAYPQARVVILPVPFERTVSYGGGTRNGPAAILKASHHLETYDLELGYEPCQAGIHTSAPLKIAKDSKELLEDISGNVARFVKDGKFPVILGGEHTISFGTVSGALRQYPDLSVLHFDAHSDCRSSYHGERYSHACALYNIRCLTKRTVSVGVRSVSAEELHYLHEEKVKIFYARDLAKNRKLPVRKILAGLSRDVFITFDIDALDPAIVEQTGTPEPGGLQWYPTLDLLQEVFRRRNVVGLDIVELAPNPAHPNADFTTAKLLYKMLGFKFQYQD
jgi:agmatinase